MVKLMDCTLRDGGNVVGKGFNAEITDLVLDGLTSAGVPIVELGNAGGIGAYEVAGFTKAETDLFEDRPEVHGPGHGARHVPERQAVSEEERGRG